MKNNGVSFFGLLTLLFVGLKLTGFIDWSWWLVLLPAYGGLALFFVLILSALVVATIAAVMDNK